MKYLFPFVLLALWVALPRTVPAQEVQQLRSLERAGTPATGSDGWIKRDLTHELINSPEGQQALAEFQQRKAQGLLPLSRKRADAVGDTMTFIVRNVETNQTENIDFVLMVVEERFQIWVELAELDNGTVNETHIEDLRMALGAQTPEGSFDPNLGIIDLDEIVFGIPPNVDGDSKTDVLWHDIRDGERCTSEGFCVLGFFDPVDLAGRNLRDIFYMDTNPTLTNPSLVEQALQTAAHEYQHLIQFNFDGTEISFINEGLSEWAEVLCGYLARSVDYLNDVDTYNISFFDFPSNAQTEEQRERNIDARERGGLFFNYIADRFGPLEAGKITRQSASGSGGLRNGLIAMNAGISLEELLFDFHAANFFNDVAFNPLYGYTTEQRQGLRAVASARFDGRTASETPSTRAGLRPGGVQYLVWEQVTDLSIQLSAVSGADALRAEAFLFGTDGSFDRMEALNFTEVGTTFDGAYGRIVVVLAHVDPDGTFTNVDYSATWPPAEQVVSLIETQYDTGQAVSGQFTLFQGQPAQATRFIVPLSDRGPLLDRVQLAPYFSNQFVDQNQNPIGDPGDPRDFTFYIWGPGGNGAPGELLFSQEIADPRAFASVTNLTLNFFEIDLTPFSAQLSALPDTIYVGYGEAGTDENFLVVGVSSYSVENVSFLGDVDMGNWAALWTAISDGRLNNTVVPIRARFAVPSATAVDDRDEVPEAVALHQNFPNPFNPTTSIRFSLPQTSEVRITVFDVLGREVAVLIDGLQPSGEHQVQVNAARWASGLYFYTLETAAQTVTQRMMLVK